MDRENHSAEFLETTVDKFVFRVAASRLYSPDGIWLLEAEGEGAVRLGLTDYFQQRNGDVAFIHIRPVGTTCGIGEEFAELETIKANVSLFMPIAGTILEVNNAVELSPETINADPYGKGWLAVLKAADWQRDSAKLLDPQSYLSLIRSEAGQESAG
jgi:glycine cleavage system H protein